LLCRQSSYSTYAFAGLFAHDVELTPETIEDLTSTTKIPALAVLHRETSTEEHRDLWKINDSWASMGLCKCRKVSNLFCFEHRANVCEHCMIKDHPKCIVRSYLQWLQDSEFSSECRLCRQPLAAADVLRLPCYDVFHWDCLAKHFAALPAHTAPAGYTCPTCESRAIPTDSMSGPVVDAVRQAFSDTAWGRSPPVLPQNPARVTAKHGRLRPHPQPTPASIWALPPIMCLPTLDSITAARLDYSPSRSSVHGSRV
jgi:hypothetical protein